ncbi:MAG: CPBP family intramembrane glutamic endopeptidase [Opitutales bacterium]
MGAVDLTPSQIAFGTAETLFLIFGAYLLARTFGPREKRTAFLAAGGLPRWALTGTEVALLVLLIFLCGVAGQSAVARLFATRIHASPDREGLEIAVFGAGFHCVALLGWPVFHLLRRHLLAASDLEPEVVAASAPVVRLTWPQVLKAAAVTLAMVLPVIVAASFLWNNLLQVLGLPSEPQDLIAIFGGKHSRLVFVGMLTVACAIAPLNEELLFRGAIFRSLRQRFGRTAALAASGLFFGVVHGNWAGALPIALLGVALAMAYERTGDIRVPIVTHGLFNLNTIVIVLSGLPQ